jgi:hypothetical protein
MLQKYKIKIQIALFKQKFYDWKIRQKIIFGAACEQIVDVYEEWIFMLTSLDSSYLILVDFWWSNGWDENAVSEEDEENEENENSKASAEKFNEEEATGQIDSSEALEINEAIDLAMLRAGYSFDEEYEFEEEQELLIGWPASFAITYIDFFFLTLNEYLSDTFSIFHGIIMGIFWFLIFCFFFSFAPYNCLCLFHFYVYCFMSDLFYYISNSFFYIYIEQCTLSGFTFDKLQESGNLYPIYFWMFFCHNLFLLFYILAWFNGNIYYNGLFLSKNIMGKLLLFCNFLVSFCIFIFFGFLFLAFLYYWSVLFIAYGKTKLHFEALEGTLWSPLKSMVSLYNYYRVTYNSFCNLSWEQKKIKTWALLPVYIKGPYTYFTTGKQYIVQRGDIFTVAAYFGADANHGRRQILKFLPLYEKGMNPFSLSISESYYVPYLNDWHKISPFRFLKNYDILVAERLKFWIPLRVPDIDDINIKIGVHYYQKDKWKINPCRSYCYPLDTIATHLKYGHSWNIANQYRTRKQFWETLWINYKLMDSNNVKSGVRIFLLTWMHGTKEWLRGFFTSYLPFYIVKPSPFKVKVIIRGSWYYSLDFSTLRDIRRCHYLYSLPHNRNEVEFVLRSLVLNCMVLFSNSPYLFYDYFGGTMKVNIMPFEKLMKKVHGPSNLAFFANYIMSPEKFQILYFEIENDLKAVSLRKTLASFKNTIV